MKYLFDLGVDGIMSAQPMRLEKTMCNMDVSRPPLPASPGQALHEEVVDRLRGAGERALPRRRRDGKASGAVTNSTAAARAPSHSRPRSGKRLAKGRFNFGWLPPPGRTRPSSDRDRFDAEAPEGDRDGKPIRAVVQPYDAFVTRTSSRLPSPQPASAARTNSTSARSASTSRGVSTTDGAAAARTMCRRTSRSIVPAPMFAWRSAPVPGGSRESLT